MHTSVTSFLVGTLLGVGLSASPLAAEEPSLPETRVHSGYIAADSSALYYERAGTGRAVVLLHAGVADSRMWDGLFTELARHCDVVRFDFRGFGRTKLAAGEFADHDDVALVLDSLGIDAAAVVALSYGARVAIDFSLAHPQRVEALVLSGPSVSGRPPPPELIRFGKEEQAALDGGNLDSAVELNLRTWVDGYRDAGAVDPAVRALVGQMQRQIFEMEIPDGVSTLRLDPPATERLHEIDVPTLVINGQYDLPAFHELGQWVAGQIRGASLITLPTAHMTSMEAPGAFCAAVVDFLEKLPASP